ncbi:MAG: hypothetical protein V4719_25145 [Planctomycetota bacterium]
MCIKLRILPVLNILIVFTLSGCAQSRYQYGVRGQTSYERPDQPQPTNPVAIGGHHPRIDRLETAVHAPGRFIKSHLPWKKDESDDRSPEQLRAEAIELAQAYLTDNNLHDVHIDVRRYEPGEQWARLLANNRISPFWKYTGGSLSVVVYSLFPARAFHSDSYNPYTNTLSLNSAKPIEALYEAGHAKEYHKHELLGTYSMSQKLPVLPLAHNWRVTSDVITYAQVSDREEVKNELYPSAYGNFSGSVVSEALYFFPIGKGATQIFASFAVKALGGGVGKLAGHAAARDLEDQPDRAEQPDSAEQTDSTEQPDRAEQPDQEQLSASE